MCPGVLQFNYKTLKVNQKFALSMKSLVVFVDILIIIFGKNLFMISIVLEPFLNNADNTRKYYEMIVARRYL